MSAIENVLTRSVPSTDTADGLAYIEKEAVYVVINRYMRVALLCSTVIALAGWALAWKMTYEFANQRPIIVRVNPDGSTSTGPYESLTYQPAAPELRHFLIKFTEWHYGRVRSTAVKDFTDKQFFLARELGQSVREQNEKTKALEKFIVSSEPNVEVYVTNVSIQDIRQSPYKASVDYVLVYKDKASSEEIKRERYTAQYEVGRLTKLPDDAEKREKFLRVNPLGLLISYIREDQEFLEVTR